MAVQSLFENQRLRTRFQTFGDTEVFADFSVFNPLLEKARRISTSEEGKALEKELSAISFNLYAYNPTKLNLILDEIYKSIQATGYGFYNPSWPVPAKPQKVVINYSTPIPTVSTVVENPSFAPDPAPLNPAPSVSSGPAPAAPAAPAAPYSNNPTGMTDADYAALVEKNKAETSALANAYRNVHAPDANVNTQANDNIQQDPAPLNPSSSGPASSGPASSAPVSSAPVSSGPAIIPDVKPKSLILPIAASIAAYLLIKG